MEAKYLKPVKRKQIMEKEFLEQYSFIIIVITIFPVNEIQCLILFNEIPCCVCLPKMNLALFLLNHAIRL